MDLWTSRSNSVRQVLLAVGCAVAGLVLVIGFRDSEVPALTPWRVFSWGCSCCSSEFAGFLLGGEQTVVVDPKARRITIEESSRFRTKKRSIPFSDIDDISIGYLGKKSNYVTWYYLVLRLRSGEEYPLFAPGRFFKGGSDKSIVATWKQRLEEYLSR